MFIPSHQVWLVGLLAFSLVGAEYYDTKTADKDFLLKQKKVYNLLYRVAQPALANITWYNEGQAWNIEANIDSYTNAAAVKEFLSIYKHGMLPRGELFSLYYPQLLREMSALFKLFYHAKDFDIFFKTALWAKNNINEAQYIYSLYTAVITRPDTKFIQLPPLYEMCPYFFFNSEVLQKANHAYFFLRQAFPFWLPSKEYDLPDYRGEEYLYSHKLLLNRYYLERLSNDLPYLEEFDWQKPFYPGYYPTMTYSNGLPFPQRPIWSNFPITLNSMAASIPSRGKSLVTI